MKLILKDLLARVFPGRYRPVKIDPNHLPGLTPPTAAPFRPTKSEPEKMPEPNYEEMYEKFKKSESSKRLDRSKKRFDA